MVMLTTRTEIQYPLSCCEYFVMAGRKTCLGVGSRGLPPPPLTILEIFYNKNVHCKNCHLEYRHLFLANFKKTVVLDHPTFPKFLELPLVGQGWWKQLRVWLAGINRIEHEYARGVRGHAPPGNIFEIKLL